MTEKIKEHKPAAGSPPASFMGGVFVGVICSTLLYLLISALTDDAEKRIAWHKGFNLGAVAMQEMYARRDGRVEDYQYFTSRRASLASENLDPEWIQKLVDDVPVKTQK